MSGYYQNSKAVTAQKLKQQFLAKQKDSDQLLSCTANQFINQLDTEIDEISNSYNIDPFKDKPLTRSDTIQVKQYLSQETDQARPQPIPHQKNHSSAQYYQFLDKKNTKDSRRTDSLESAVPVSRHASLKIISKKPPEKTPKQEHPLQEQLSALLAQQNDCLRLVQHAVTMPPSILKQDLFQQVQFLLQDLQQNINGQKQEMSINENIMRQNEEQKRELLTKLKRLGEQLMTSQRERVLAEEKAVELKLQRHKEKIRSKSIFTQTTQADSQDIQVQTSRRLEIQQVYSMQWGASKGGVHNKQMEQQIETQMKLIQVLEQQIEQDRIGIQQQGDRIEEMGQSRVQQDIQYKNILSKYKHTKDEARQQIELLNKNIAQYSQQVVQQKVELQRVNELLRQAKEQEAQQRSVLDAVHQEVSLTKHHTDKQNKNIYELKVALLEKSQQESGWKEKINVLQTDYKKLKSDYDHLQMKSLNEQHFLLKVYKKLKHISQAGCLMQLASFTKKLKNKLKQDQQTTLRENNVLSAPQNKYHYESRAKKHTHSQSSSQNQTQVVSVPRPPSVPCDKEEKSMTLRDKLNQQRALLV